MNSWKSIRLIWNEFTTIIWNELNQRKLLNIASNVNWTNWKIFYWKHRLNLTCLTNIFIFFSNKFLCLLSCIVIHNQCQIDFVHDWNQFHVDQSTQHEWSIIDRIWFLTKKLLWIFEFSTIFNRNEKTLWHENLVKLSQSEQFSIETQISENWLFQTRHFRNQSITSLHDVREKTWSNHSLNAISWSIDWSKAFEFELKFR